MSDHHFESVSQEQITQPRLQDLHSIIDSGLQTLQDSQVTDFGGQSHRLTLQNLEK